MEASEEEKKFAAYLQLQHKAESTVEAYMAVVGSFRIWLRKNPRMAEQDRSRRVEAYLTYRVQHDDVSPSTQNVELNALVSFYRMLGVEIKDINAVRAKRHDRIPPILSHEQVRIMLEHFPKNMALIPALLYGCGMRINEVLRLRLKDVDFEKEKLVIHEAKGDKDRDVPIPVALLSLVRSQYERASESWNEDKAHRFNGVNCGGIEKKYPAYRFSKDWYWLLPDDHLSTDPKSGTPYMRHHVMDWKVQRIFVRVREQCGLPVYFSAHKLRHACLSHMADDMRRQGIPEKMMKAGLKDLAGHIADETIERYIHLSVPRNAVVRSPIEGMFSDAVA